MATDQQKLREAISTVKRGFVVRESIPNSQFDKYDDAIELVIKTAERSLEPIEGAGMTEADTVEIICDAYHNGKFSGRTIHEVGKQIFDALRKAGVLAVKS